MCSIEQTHSMNRHDQKIIDRPHVLTGIRHHENIRLKNRRGAKGDVAGSLGNRNANLGFEPLPVSVYQADQRNGRLAYMGSQQCEIVESGFWFRVENLVTT